MLHMAWPGKDSASKYYGVTSGTSKCSKMHKRTQFTPADALRM